MGETSTGDTARLGCENPAQGGSIAQRGSGLVGDETSTGDAAALGARTAQKEDAPNGEFTEETIGVSWGAEPSRQVNTPTPILRYALQRRTDPCAKNFLIPAAGTNDGLVNFYACLS
jgi:hypothetical protein